MPSEAVFTTARLRARTALPEDAPFFFRLWTHPQVMVHAGFPNGLRITLEEVQALLERDQELSILERRLVVVLRSSGEMIGESHLGVPDAEGIVETDVKLLPEFWGRRYGVEIKQALVDYLFTHTDCKAVQATPNINNAASINMQKAVGAVRTGRTAPTLGCLLKPDQDLVIAEPPVSLTRRPHCAAGTAHTVLIPFFVGQVATGNLAGFLAPGIRVKVPPLKRPPFIPSHQG